MSTAARDLSERFNSWIAIRGQNPFRCRNGTQGETIETKTPSFRTM
jgi:hypothetical protein